MNQVATIERPIRSVLVDMSTRYGMEPAAFEATLRATVIQKASKEELAAFLLVAKEYTLNPLTKEIYAFPARGGGIVPIVSIDGWVNLINSHPAADGFEFDMNHDDKGELVSCTCRMFRKDRSHAVTVTEYLSECIRSTEPWKMKHRMLRHKALIQAARYAFGFSGIYDEDEGHKIAEMRDVTPRDEPPAPPPAPSAVAQPTSREPAPEVEIIPPVPAAKAEEVPDADTDPAGFIAVVTDMLNAAKAAEELSDIWDDHVERAFATMFPPDEERIRDVLMPIYRARERVLS